MAQSVSEAESSRRLTLSNLVTVRDALYDARSKWEDIGIELMSKNDTDAIKKEKGNDVVGCLTEMLSVYLKRANPEPSWSSIIAALKARAVGESQLAQELERKYLSQTATILTVRQQNVEPAQIIDHQFNNSINGEALQQSLTQNQEVDPSVIPSFPYLDTSKLSPHEKTDLIQRLSKDYTNILVKFAKLQTSTCESLCRQNISADRIANCALSLALYKSDEVPRPLLADEQESFEEVKSVVRVFVLLRKHKLISYFDYGILKHIIETYGTEDDKYRLREYVVEFQTFCQRKVYEVPPVISECTSPTRKMFKVLITRDMFTTLTDIEAAERKLADILGLHHSVLTIHEIKLGSLVLTLSIPILIAHKIFPLQASQLSELRANGFTILSDKLSVTVHDVSIETKSVKYAKELWKKIEDVFHLSDYNALLDHIYEADGIVVVWLIPPSASEALLKPRAQPWSAIDFLQREGIVRMTLNDNSCMYDIQESKKLLELCNKGSFEEVILLLKSHDKGAAINATFEEIHEGKSALMLVCEHGHISLVLTVLDRGAEVNHQQKTTGQSALHLAAKNGHLGAVHFLLAYGADPNLMDLSAATAASVAIQEGHTSLGEELHKGKSESRIRTRNPLQYASDTIDQMTSPGSSGTASRKRRNLVLKEGFLYMKGDIIKSWTRRYFILNKQTLCYFHQEQKDGSADDLHPLGRIFLSDIVKIETDGVEEKKPFVFALYTKKRAVLLQAANVDDKEGWATAIRNALESEGEAERKNPFRRTLRKLAPGLKRITLVKDPDIGFGCTIKCVAGHVFVNRIIKDGPIGLTGVLRPGDELVDIHGQSMAGMTITQVVEVVKAAPEVVIVTVRPITEGDATPPPLPRRTEDAFILVDPPPIRDFPKRPPKFHEFPLFDDHMKSISAADELYAPMKMAKSKSTGHRYVNVPAEPKKPTQTSDSIDFPKKPPNLHEFPPFDDHLKSISVADELYAPMKMDRSKSTGHRYVNVPAKPKKPTQTSDSIDFPKQPPKLHEFPLFDDHMKSISAAELHAHMKVAKSKSTGDNIDDNSPHYVNVMANQKPTQTSELCQQENERYVKLPNKQHCPSHRY